MTPWIIWLSFSVRKQPPPPRPQGSPVRTSPHQTPEHSGCPATGSPRQVNKYPSALPPSPPPVPPGPGHTHAHQFGKRNSDIRGVVHLTSKTSGYSWGWFIHYWMPSILDAERIRIIKSPRLQWGTGHRWWRSWGHWDWATTLAGRWGFLWSAIPPHTFLSAGPHPSGALLCRSELGSAPFGHQWRGT